MDCCNRCKISLISWPIKNKSPQSGYVNFGEIYDRKIKSDKTILEQFHQELAYLYPFRCVTQPNLACYNIEDIRYFQKKYKLTVKLKMNGVFDKVITLRSPVLYDITCMVPLFPKHRKEVKKLTTDKKHVCVVLPYKNPVLRGKMLSRCLDLESNTFFILLGDKLGKNKDSCATLATRYLLSRAVPAVNMIKSLEGTVPDCILDSLALVELMGIENFIFTIVCSSEDISEISTTVRTWRKEDRINVPLIYLSVHDTQP